MQNKDFSYPETCAYYGVHVSVKTRKLSNGRFEAIAAIFACGKRGLTVYAIARSRSTASREAERATESRSKLIDGLKRGVVSYSQAVTA